MTCEKLSHSLCDMEALEFREALARLELSQADLARLTDTTTRGVQMWAKGDRAVPGPVAAFLRVFEMLPAAKRASVLRQSREG